MTLQRKAEAHLSLWSVYLPTIYLSILLLWLAGGPGYCFALRKSFEKPKSVIFICVAPASCSKMFSNFRSRWQTDCEWQ